MTDTDTSDYPSWRKALFGEDTVANLLCFVKWVLWQGLYVVLGVLGLILVGSAWVFDKILSTASSSRAASLVQSDRVKTAAWWLWMGWLLFWGGYCTVVVAQFFYSNPMALVGTLAVIGTLTVIFITAVVIRELFGEQIVRGVRWINSVLGRGHERAAQTPGVRRVVGRCPVSFTLSPRWFDKIFSRFTP